MDLSDKACHKIFESLFRFIAVERSIYNRAQRSSSKSPSSTRLSTCASVLRTAVDIFLRNIRTKTVRAIIDHITETIPIPGEGLWEPLNVDYTKCLASLLRYPPHTEHLGDAEWEKLVEFCLAAINLQESEGSQLSIRSGGRPAAEDALDASDGRSTPSRLTPAPPAKERYMGDRNAIGEVLVCIQLLVASPSAPVQAAAENLLHGLADFVRSPSMMAGNSHQFAFSSINTVIWKVLFDQSELVRSSLLGMIPVIRRLWSTKLQGLKDELLRTLMLGVIILIDASRNSPSQSLAESIHELTYSIHSEYARRPEKELLQVDETIFHNTTANGHRSVYGPRLGNFRSETNWTTVWTIAELLALSEAVTSLVSKPGFNREANKRQRLNSDIEDVFRNAVSATGTQRICALQLVPFLESRIDVEKKSSFLRRLVPSILDDNATLSSWSMVAVARFVQATGLCVNVEAD